MTEQVRRRRCRGRLWLWKREGSISGAPRACHLPEKEYPVNNGQSNLKSAEVTMLTYTYAQEVLEQRLGTTLTGRPEDHLQPIVLPLKGLVLQ